MGSSFSPKSALQVDGRRTHNPKKAQVLNEHKQNRPSVEGRDLRASLSESELAGLPANPAGAIELPDEALNEVNGGASWLSFCRTVCGVYCTITNLYDCIRS